MSLFTIDAETSTVSDIRAMVTDTEIRLSEGQQAEALATEALEAARARRGLDDSPATRSELDKARKRLATANEHRLGLEATLRRLHRGLETAIGRDTEKARRKWRVIADDQRRRSASDRAATADMLDKIGASLDQWDAYLTTRKRELERLATEAAGEGASFGVAPARGLGDDHRAYRGLRQTLDYLASVRRPN